MIGISAADTAPADIVTVKLIVPAEVLMQIACMAAGADRTTVSRELIALETLAKLVVPVDALATMAYMIVGDGKAISEGKRGLLALNPSGQAN